MEDGGTETWTNLVDRGGLWHVSDETYSIFAAVEEEIRRHLAINTVDKQQEGAKRELMDSVLRNEDILFQWCMLSSDMEDDVASALLKQIVELYVTIRGFAFVSSCLELYKQKQKTTLQKKKALRRELCYN